MTLRMGSAGTVLLGCALLATPATAQMSPDMMLQRMDADGDGRISAAEFKGKRRPFSFFDRDGDGYATREEIEAAMGRGPRAGAAPGRAPEARIDGQVPIARIDEETRCAISRGRGCDIRLAVARGLFETGLYPRFPEGLSCRGIDERWAISYGHKRDRENYHGGIDMPAPFGTPIVAAAAGTVVARFEGADGYRGREIVIRHSPEDTGLPLWIYTQYAHFDAMPAVQVGQRVRMGEPLGPTGNSGISPFSGRKGKERRPAIHFAAWFSTSQNFAVTDRDVVPADAQWMDPNALYRSLPPFDSETLKALLSEEKAVPIPVLLEDGTTSPAGTKLIWPYTCSRD